MTCFAGDPSRLLIKGKTPRVPLQPGMVTACTETPGKHQTPTWPQARKPQTWKCCLKPLPVTPSGYMCHLQLALSDIWTLTVSALSGETKSKPALREPASELESHLTAVPGASATAEQGEMCERCSETRWGLHPDPPIYQVDRFFWGPHLERVTTLPAPGLQ